MSERSNGILASSEVDPILVHLIDELADQLQAGESVDWDAVAGQHPERIEQVRKMLPAIAAIAELGSVAGRDRSRSHIAMPGSISILGELGDYRILREIGRGGMGVVYEAVQISLGRRVALKVLPFAPALDTRQLQRFQNEARASAHLNHVNIVPVYAVGCERGVHYYAMQFIEGQSLSVLIDELRRIEGSADENPGARDEEAFALASELASGRFAPAGTTTVPVEESELQVCGQTIPAEDAPAPTARMSATGSSTRASAYFRTVARMGMQAAQALEHAHQQGVIHRDVKPSNLLVDVRGNLWVADFGLARFQNEAGLTMTADLLGTLRYMSPEQALGKSGMADYRTDIYSLGVTLYELLTLRPAVPGQDRQEILRKIADDDPPSARSLNTSVPLDLETIVLKAMAKEPGCRYATAQALADDLDRYLKDEPILARRSTLRQRLGRWARRHQALVWSAGVSAVFLMLMAMTALAVSNVLIHREKSAKEQALEAARASEATAHAQEEVARQNLLKACEAVDLLLTRVAEERLLNRPQMESVRRVLLEDAARFYQELVKQEGTNRKVRHGAAKAYFRLSYLQHQLREVERAVTSDQQAIALLEQLRAEESLERSVRFDLSQAYRQLGSLSLTQGKAKEAVKACGESIALCTELVAEAPGDSRYQLELATSQSELGTAHSVTMRPREAEEACRQALASAEKLQAGADAGTRTQFVLAWCNYRVGEIVGKEGRYREAETYLRKALNLARKLVAEPGPHSEYTGIVVDILTALGNTLKAAGQLTESRDAFREAFDLLEKLVVDFPGFQVFQSELEDNRTNLCILLEAAKTPREAEEFYQRNVAALGKLIEESPHTPKYRLQLAYFHFARATNLHYSRPKDAEAAYRRIVVLAEALVAEFPELPGCGVLLGNCKLALVGLLLDKGQQEEPVRLCPPTLALAERLAAEYPRDPPIRELLGRSYQTRGRLLKETFHTTEAEAAFRSGLATVDKLSGDFPESPNYLLEAAYAYRELALLLAEGSVRRGDADEAHRHELSLLERGTATFRTWPNFVEQIAHSHRLWGFLLQRQGRLEGAEMSIREAVKVLQESGADYPGEALAHRRLLGNTYELLASLLALAGRPREATEAFRKALELPPPEDDALACNDRAWMLATWAYAQPGDGRRAVELAQKAVELVPDSGDYWNTLGAAYCKAEDWKAAALALEKAHKRLGAVIQVSSNECFLAIAHAHLAHKSQARDWYSRAVVSTQKYAPNDPFYQRLRAEAQKLIGDQSPSSADGAKK